MSDDQDYEELYERLTRTEQQRDDLLAALEDLLAWQNGPPLPSYEQGWTAANDHAYALIARTKHEQQHLKEVL